MNRYIKALLLTFIIITSVFFINIDEGRALGDGTGYAECYYYHEETVNKDPKQTVPGANDPRVGMNSYGSYNSDVTGYFVGIKFYKEGNDNKSFKAFADVKCGMSKTDQQCNITNYNDIFHNASSYAGYFGASTDCVFKGKCSKVEWKCPSNIYVKKTKESKDMEIQLSSGKGGTAWAKTSEVLKDSGNPDTHFDNYKDDVTQGTHADSNGNYEEGNASEQKNNRTNIDKKLIEDWAKGSGDSGLKEGTSGCELIATEIIDFLNTLFKIIQIIGVILLIVLSALDFIKAITGADEDGLKGAFKSTFKRIILVVILLILPMIIIWILNAINSNATGDYEIGSNGEVICK